MTETSRTTGNEKAPAPPLGEAAHEAVRDVLSGWMIGQGYYTQSISPDDANELADQILDELTPFVADRPRPAQEEPGTTSHRREVEARLDAATQPPWTAEGSQVLGPDGTLVAAVRDHSETEPRPDAELIAHAPEDLRRLLDLLAEYEESINWGTSCTRCADVLTASYEAYVRAEQAEAALARATSQEVADDPVCCSRCYDSSRGTTFAMMVVCSRCGNKRCPRATWHGYRCTGSNDVAQVPELDEEES